MEVKKIHALILHTCMELHLDLNSRTETEQEQLIMLFQLLSSISTTQ